MLPHSTFGIRVRGCRRWNVYGSGGGAKSISFAMLRTLGAIASMGLSAAKVPFYRKLYMQGRRG